MIKAPSIGSNRKNLIKDLLEISKVKDILFPLKIGSIEILLFSLNPLPESINSEL